VIGKQHQLLKERTRFFVHSMAQSVTATIHPSSVLRSPDPKQREADYAAFLKDLKAVRRKLDEFVSFARRAATCRSLEESVAYRLRPELIFSNGFVRSCR
jgi:hypothetical protein